MSKSNIFLKYFRNINKFINSLLEQNLNKLNSKNFIILARSNKLFIIFVALIILLLSYLSLPNLFSKKEISEKLKVELKNKLNVNFKFSNSLQYSFLPQPHFIIEKTFIVLDEKNISEIKDMKIYISPKNLFSLKNIRIKNLVLDDANFDLNNKNYNFFVNLLNGDFSNGNLKIKNGNIFFRNEEKEVLFINKILDLKYYFDNKKSKNILISDNELFNIPYDIEIYNSNNEKKLYSKINLNLIKLQVENVINYNSEITEGNIDFIFNKTKSTAVYKKNKNFLEVDYFDKIEDPKFMYNARLNFKPFHSIFTGKAAEIDLFNIFNREAFLVQLLKTEIFHNKNINLEFTLNADKIYKFNNFKNISLNSRVQEGLIDIDNSSFNWRKYANFNFFDSLIYVKNGKLILDSRSQIQISNSDEIYKILLTPKKFRKKIDKIDLNFTYNFDDMLLILNDIKVNGKFNESLNSSIKDILIKNSNFQNKIFFKNLLNSAIKSYSG